jgi:hypothetical protein
MTDLNSWGMFVRLHLYVYAATLAAICALTLTSAAHAATVGVSPSGAINARGRLTLGTSGGTMDCMVSLNGSLLSSAPGTLGWGNLTTNPIIGSVTSASLIMCNVGTATALFSSPAIWTIRNYGQVNGAGGRGALYIQGVQILYDLPGVIRCLYTAIIRAFSINGSATITLGDGASHNLQLFTTNNLGTGICPLGTPTLRGTMALAQAITAILT